MVDDFIKGIASALKGMGYPIYTEEMPMGFIRPCFTVRADKISSSQALGGYIKQRCIFIVEYYGTNEEHDGAVHGKNHGAEELEPLVYDALRVVRASGKAYRAVSLGSQKKSQITTGNISSNVEGVGGILAFTAEYVRFIKDMGADAVMSRLYEV